MKKKSQFNNIDALRVISLFFVIPAGIYCKFYAGPWMGWVSDSLCGVFYEIFWCLLLSLFLSKTRPVVIAAVVLSATCALEVLQLSHNPVLEFVRGFYIGHILIGSSFHWTDFIYYAAGSVAGMFWLKGLGKITKTPF